VLDWNFGRCDFAARNAKQKSRRFQHRRAYYYSLEPDIALVVKERVKEENACSDHLICQREIINQAVDSWLKSSPA
jgi:hypothetical protein